MNYKKLIRPNLKVTLKKTKKKGVGLYATQKIDKGEVIAFYKIKIFRKKDYESPTNSVYLIEVYQKNGKPYKTLIGDIDENSFPEPVDGIPFWAPFANEPSKNEKTNSELEIELKTNYSDRKYSTPGESMTYNLVATKKILPGEEIMWFYGKDYDRDYEIKI